MKVAEMVVDDREIQLQPTRKLLIAPEVHTPCTRTTSLSTPNTSIWVTMKSPSARPRWQRTFGLSTVASIHNDGRRKRGEKLEDGMSMFFAECHQRIEDNEALSEDAYLPDSTKNYKKYIAKTNRDDRDRARLHHAEAQISIRALHEVRVCREQRKGNLGTGFF